MKKQFFRVKQLADQTFSRAGKTDVLSDDLQEADRKVEYIKNSCQNVGKKLSTCMVLGQLQGESGTKEKLMKKTPGYQLGATMLECGAMCDDESLMKMVLNKCGNAEKILSEENVEHHQRVEQHVITPLQNVLDNEIPNITKQKRNVTKVCLDMDSAKARYQQAQKHNSNNTAGSSKIESIKDELKDSEQKVEQSRDVLACELFHLASRESELCYTILQYYKFQKHYHEYALGILESLIPELENDICTSKTKPVYGIDLEEHLQVTGRKIAFPIELCVCALLELGLEEEGLFRLAGGASKLKRMKLSFDAGCMSLATALSYRDPHVIAGALKSYLRELPEPLLTHSLYDEWLNAAKAQTHPDNKLQTLWTVVHKLPKANFDNLGYLIKFFHILSKNHEVNKMSPHNLAIVIAPSLIWTKDENVASGFGLNANVSLYPSIIDLLVTYADWFFDKEMEFYLTLEPIMNGEFEDKSSDRGIDNKGFDPKTSDKMHRSAIEKSSGQNQSCGDSEGSLQDMKRSQSISSLSEEVHNYESPKPITRRKNKSVAPGPPVFKDDRKREDVKLAKDNSPVGRTKDPQTVCDKPDKPPRPNATLPRSSKNNRDSKLFETDQEDPLPHSTDDLILNNKTQSDNVEKSSSFVKQGMVIRTVATVSSSADAHHLGKEPCSILATPSPSISLNRKSGERPVAAPRSFIAEIEVSEKPKADSDLIRPAEYSKVNLLSVKKEWLLGKDSADIESVPLKKPAVPERPLILKPQTFKFNRVSIDSDFRHDLGNPSLSPKENLTGGGSDDGSLPKTQLHSIERHQRLAAAVDDVGNRDKIDPDKSSQNDGADENDEQTSTKEVEKSTPEKKKEENHSDKGDKDVIVPVEERKTASFNANRPVSLPGGEKPERPPKPDYKFSSSSSSHTRTYSDGHIIEIKPSDNNTGTNSSNINKANSGSSQCIKHLINNNFGSEINHLSASSSSPPTFSAVIKHPQTSPPPPPVPAKPRANSQSESTDF